MESRSITLCTNIEKLLKLQLYDSNFENTLSREVDIEDLEITCSCGLINATRVFLDKGKATIRLYPFGYKGKFKLKLGWRWWPGLNEYELLLTD